MPYMKDRILNAFSSNTLDFVNTLVRIGVL
jgi:hypothetical protein